MSVRMSINDITYMNTWSFGETLVEIEGSEWFLIDEEGFGFFPYSFSLNGFIDDVLVELDIVIINKGVDLFVEKSDKIFGILSG